MLEGQALSAYIRKAETSTDQEQSIGNLLRMLSRNEVKASDIQAHYKQECTPTLNAMIQSYSWGELFTCQKANFTNWLNGKDHKRDEELAYAFKATAEMCGLTEKNNRTVYDIWEFVKAMIIRNVFERQRQAQSIGENIYRDMWAKRCQRDGWTWNHNGAAQ